MLSGCWSVDNQHYFNLLVHLNAIDKAIEFCSKTSDKLLIAGDFMHK